MGTLTKRKVYRTGKDKATYCLNLPKGWCFFNGLKQGQEVIIMANNVLVVIPPNLSHLVEEVRSIFIKGL